MPPKQAVAANQHHELHASVVLREPSAATMLRAKSSKIPQQMSHAEHLESSAVSTSGKMGFQLMTAHYTAQMIPQTHRFSK